MTTATPQTEDTSQQAREVEISGQALKDLYRFQADSASQKWMEKLLADGEGLWTTDSHTALHIDIDHGLDIDTPHAIEGVNLKELKKGTSVRESTVLTIEPDQLTEVSSRWEGFARIWPDNISITADISGSELYQAGKAIARLGKLQEVHSHATILELTEDSSIALVATDTGSAEYRIPLEARVESWEWDRGSHIREAAPRWKERLKERLPEDAYHQPFNPNYLARAGMVCRQNKRNYLGVQIAAPDTALAVTCQSSRDRCERRMAIMPIRF